MSKLAVVPAGSPVVLLSTAPVLVPVELAAPVLLPGAVLLLPELPRVGDPVEAPKPAEPGLSPDPQANKTIRAK